MLGGASFSADSIQRNHGYRPIDRLTVRDCGDDFRCYNYFHLIESVVLQPHQWGWECALCKARQFSDCIWR